MAPVGPSQFPPRQGGAGLQYAAFPPRVLRHARCEPHVAPRSLFEPLSRSAPASNPDSLRRLEEKELAFLSDHTPECPSGPERPPQRIEAWRGQLGGFAKRSGGSGVVGIAS
eukprot:CAMPEP_0113560106 /NCGR_PEP_ID=MMETSP0015_2-20120614/19252_1 /TAXON_ID=2838 /ORGANISM="Odontella" /LENGTH=111 /DNA_ID=CAMNT_0000461785 /DNA_START=36 /DNA_END=371 /DNA_ORIENTATION=+ /assembly_acc=CAM_ASM_000160